MLPRIYMVTKKIEITRSVKFYEKESLPKMNGQGVESTRERIIINISNDWLNVAITK